jgi:hypothetical protein
LAFVFVRSVMPGSSRRNNNPARFRFRIANIH